MGHRKGRESPINGTTANAVATGATRTSAETLASPATVGNCGASIRANPAAALVIALAEGEKDAALLASSGVIAFTAPRGAQSLPLADFAELVELARETGLPVVLCGDNDKVGRDAMRRVRAILKMDHHLDASYLFGEEGKGSVADYPAEDLKALLRVKLADRKPSWQKPIRNRAEYEDFKCPRPKTTIKRAGDVAGIYSFVPCGNTATCPKCCAWENYLHVERCWKGNPAQMVQVALFGLGYFNHSANDVAGQSLPWPF